MYVREKNKEIVELVILVGGKEEFMLMSFCGVIDLKKISRLAIFPDKPGSQKTTQAIHSERSDIFRILIFFAQLKKMDRR